MNTINDVFTMSSCQLCPMGCDNPNSVIPGKGYTQATLMLVGERLRFNSVFGNEREKILKKSINVFMGVKDDRLFITSMIKCNSDEEELDKGLQKKAITQCLNYLHKQIEIIDPVLIILVGRPTALKVLGLPQKTTMKSLMNKVHEKDGHFYWVTWNPGYVIRNERKFGQWKKNFLQARKHFNRLVSDKYPMFEEKGEMML